MGPRSRQEKMEGKNHVHAWRSICICESGVDSGVIWHPPPLAEGKGRSGMEGAFWWHEHEHAFKQQRAHAFTRRS